MSWPIRSRYRSVSNKYGAKRTETDGYSFASKLEASVYQILKLREKAKEIEILQTQDHIYLTQARIGYIPDFKCIFLDTNIPFWVEAKGFETDKWPIIKKLWRYYGPGVLEIWKGTHINPILIETISPIREHNGETN